METFGFGKAFDFWVKSILEFGKPSLRIIDFGIIDFEKGDLYEIHTRCMIWKILYVYSIKCFDDGSGEKGAPLK